MARAGANRDGGGPGARDPQARHAHEFVLDDRSGRIEVTFFEDVYQQYRALIVKDAILVVEGKLRFDEFIETGALPPSGYWTSTRRESSTRAASCCAGHVATTPRTAAGW